MSKDKVLKRCDVCDFWIARDEDVVLDTGYCEKKGLEDVDCDDYCDWHTVDGVKTESK